MCTMKKAVSGQPLHAAYCLQMLAADSSMAVAAAEAQEGTVPVKCSPAACHPGVVQRCGRPAG